MDRLQVVRLVDLQLKYKDCVPLPYNRLRLQLSCLEGEYKVESDGEI